MISLFCLRGTDESYYGPMATAVLRSLKRTVRRMGLLRPSRRFLYSILLISTIVLLIYSHRKTNGNVRGRELLLLNDDTANGKARRDIGTIRNGESLDAVAGVEGGGRSDGEFLSVDVSEDHEDNNSDIHPLDEAIALLDQEIEATTAEMTNKSSVSTITATDELDIQLDPTDQSEVALIRYHFHRCSQEKLSMQHYITAYQHVYTLLTTLGAVFGIVARDAHDKLDILVKLSKDGPPTHGEGLSTIDHYRTVESMILHERELNSATGAALYGSRTLLRLHRALKFVLLFVRGLSKNDNPKGESVSDMAYRSYAESLGVYHTWVLRQSARMAVYTLPQRRELFDKLCPGVTDEKMARMKLRGMSKEMERVHTGVELLFDQYQLHDLP